MKEGIDVKSVESRHLVVSGWRGMCDFIILGMCRQRDMEEKRKVWEEVEEVEEVGRICFLPRGPPQGYTSGIRGDEAGWLQGYTGRGTEPGFDPEPEELYTTEQLPTCRNCGGYFQAFDELSYHLSIFHPEYNGDSAPTMEELPHCTFCAAFF